MVAQSSGSGHKVRTDGRQLEIIERSSRRISTEGREGERLVNRNSYWAQISKQRRATLTEEIIADFHW